MIATIIISILIVIAVIFAIRSLVKTGNCSGCADCPKGCGGHGGSCPVSEKMVDNIEKQIK